MMASLVKSEMFIITYDDGLDGQVLRVPHGRYYENEVFAKNVTHIKCLDCNLEFNYSEEKS